MGESASSWLPFIDIVDDEGYPTRTTIDEEDTERAIRNHLKSEFVFEFGLSKRFLLNSFDGFDSKFIKLSAQEPWIPYWFTNSARILNMSSLVEKEEIVDYLSARKGVDGGYALSHHQPGHLLLTYPSINALCIIGTEHAYQSIERRDLHKWILSLKLPNGCYQAVPGGEADARTTYVAIAVCSLLNMLTPEVTSGVAEFLRCCQNYDGGFSPNPGMESHAGFSFCAVAALKILGRLDFIDKQKAIRWASSLQTSYAGGFCGRPNKLVDTCYTWWVGSMCRILSDEVHSRPFWNEEALACYVLRVCQGEEGGLMDKPGKQPDLFHTMYGLSGLSVAAKTPASIKYGLDLPEFDAVYGVPREYSEKMISFFKNQPF